MSYVTIALGASALLTAGISYYSGQKQAKAIDAATAQAKKAAKTSAVQAAATASAADEAANRENMALPDTAGMLASAMLSGRAGMSGTMLTGPQGIKDKLNVGKTSLLGS